MKIKRFIPAIVAFLFSCIILIGAPAYMFFSADYPKDLGKKFEMTLGQGLWVALFAIILIWIGTGLDFGLSRIKKRVVRIYVSLLIYLTPSVLCGLAALFILLVNGSLAPSTGWKELPAPPTVPVQVAAVGESSIYILTESGNYFYCGIKTPSSCWEPVDEPDERIVQNDAGTLVETFASPSSDPAGDVLSMVGVEYNDFGVEGQVHYAVLADGTVQYLEKNGGKAASDFGSGLFLTIIVLPGLLALCGIYFGAGTSALSRWLAGRIWREPETV